MMDDATEVMLQTLQDALRPVFVDDVTCSAFKYHERVMKTLQPYLLTDDETIARTLTSLRDLALVRDSYFLDTHTDRWTVHTYIVAALELELASRRGA